MDQKKENKLNNKLIKEYGELINRRKRSKISRGFRFGVEVWEFFDV